MDTQLKWQNNFYKLYGYSFFQFFLVSLPVIVPYWQSNGLSLQEIFMLQGIFGAALIIFDLPAGYIADLFGRKKTMIIGTMITLIGYQFLWLGETFFHFALFEFVLGLGFSLQSGCDVAILYDTLDELKLKAEKGKYLGRRILATQIGEGISSIGGGLLAAYSLKWPMIAQAITPIGTVICATLVFDQPKKFLARESHIKNFRFIGKALFGHSRLLTLLIFSYVIYSFATYCAIWCLQTYWKSRGLDYAWFGYLWAANCFLIGIIGQYAHRIEAWIGSTWSVLIIAITPIIGYLGMGSFGGWLGISFMIFFPICRGLNVVLFQDAVNSRVPSEIRATTNSIGSLGMRMIFIIFGPLLGYLIDKNGPDEALQFMGYVYIASFVVLILPLLKQRQHFVRS